MIDHVREIWDENGGGFYAAGAVVTFLGLEAASFAEDLAEAGGVLPLLRDGVVDWFVGFAIESVLFAVTAAIWPLKWIDVFGLQQGLLVIGMAWALWWLGERAVARWRPTPAPPPDTSP